MTRINLVEPRLLSRQHLIAEYRELPRIFSRVRKAISQGKKPTDFKIPKTYVLGTGHMTFFYNKLKFLYVRQQNLIDEMKHRGYNVSYDNPFPLVEGIPIEWFGDYKPDDKAIELNKKRISERS